MTTLTTRLMPIIIPATGVDGTIWTATALEVMKNAGCLWGNPIEGPLMCAPSNGFGDFMKRGLRSSGVSKVLRRFLEIEEPPPGCQDEIVSSHSLKATLLAWCAGLDSRPKQGLFWEDMHQA